MWDSGLVHEPQHVHVIVICESTTLFSFDGMFLSLSTLSDGLVPLESTSLILIFFHFSRCSTKMLTLSQITFPRYYCISFYIAAMNFYFEACKVLDRLDGKQGSIKGIIASLPEKDRKRTAALVIETLKCETALDTVLCCSYSRSITVKAVLHQVIEASDLLKTERKKITSLNLALVLVHDLLLARGIQAGDGPVKQAILRHKARLHGEFQKAKIKKGVSSNAGLANDGDERAGNFILDISFAFLTQGSITASIPRYVRVNTLKASIPDVVSALQEQGFTEGDPFNSKCVPLSVQQALNDQHLGKDVVCNGQARTRSASSATPNVIPKQHALYFGQDHTPRQGVLPTCHRPVSACL